MNSDIIPQGPSELVGAGALIRDALLIKSTGAASTVLTSIVFDFVAAPANAAAVTGCTLTTGDALYNVKTCTIGSGVAYVIYRK